MESSITLPGSERVDTSPPFSIITAFPGAPSIRDDRRAKWSPTRSTHASDIRIGAIDRAVTLACEAASRPKLPRSQNSGDTRLLSSSRRLVQVRLENLGLL
jgi:hypothetical protein